jgi:hypothetical protein
MEILGGGRFVSNRLAVLAAVLVLVVVASSPALAQTRFPPASSITLV